MAATTATVPFTLIVAPGLVTPWTTTALLEALAPSEGPRICSARREMADGVGVWVGGGVVVGMGSGVCVGSGVRMKVGFGVGVGGMAISVGVGIGVEVAVGMWFSIGVRATVGVRFKDVVGRAGEP